MFMSLDFEWWEKSSETILEVGWSMWDTATQKHRTRHWIIRENLNKVSGGRRAGTGALANSRPVLVSASLHFTCSEWGCMYCLPLLLWKPACLFWAAGW
jgi:hypothetical protein